MDEIKRIYLGLPDRLTKIVFWVGRKYRTNTLSHQPGGGDIIVEYHSGKVFGYDWIKYPSRYVVSIFNRHFSKSNEDFENFKEHVQLGIIKKEVSRLFARIYEKDEFETVNFEEVWNSKTDDKLPWEKLKEFEDTKYEERIEKQKSQLVELEMVAEKQADYTIKNKSIKLDVNDLQNSEPKIDLDTFKLPDKIINAQIERKRRRNSKYNTSKNKSNKNINSLENLLPKEIIERLKNLK